MNPPRYETTAPNIARVDVDGAQVQVTWKCLRGGQFRATKVAEESAAQAGDP